MLTLLVPVGIFVLGIVVSVACSSAAVQRLEEVSKK